MKMTDFTYEVSFRNPRDVPMLETDYHTWLSCREECETNGLNSIVSYIESLGFDASKHFIAGWCFRDLRYIYSNHYRQVILPSKTPN